MPPTESSQPLLDVARRLEARATIDGAAGPVADGLRAQVPESARSALRGDWLGHALHPLLTDFPLGCWAAAGLLDLVGGRSSQKAAQRLVGLGLVFVPVTAAAGAVDWSESDDPRVRRVGAVHGAGNLVVGFAYWRSWRNRRRGRHLRGVGWGLAGGTLAWVTGYLGGHLSLVLGAGHGPRGPRGEAATTATRGEAATTATRGEAASGGDRGAAGAHQVRAGSAATVGAEEAADILDVRPEMVERLVEEGVIGPADGQGRYDRGEVEAARLLGG